MHGTRLAHICAYSILYACVSNASKECFVCVLLYLILNDVFVLIDNLLNELKLSFEFALGCS